MEMDVNPMGLDGFEFCEFTSPDPDRMADQLEQFGFVAASTHPTRAVTRYKQGRINLLLNREPGGHAAGFGAAHGPSASAMAFRVQDAAAAYDAAIASGAKPAPAGQALDGIPALEGIGGSILYLVDRHGAAGSIYDDWIPVPGAAEAEAANNVGLDLLDHLTHNVRRGQMRTWSEFYGRIFGFEEQKYFDIKGKATGLFSQAMIAPDRAIRIPLNESQDDKSQIEEFIKDYNGEGIQHLALTTNDIFATVEKLRARGVRLQDTIESYYGRVDKRVPGQGQRPLSRVAGANVVQAGGEVELRLRECGSQLVREGRRFAAEVPFVPAFGELGADSRLLPDPRAEGRAVATWQRQDGEHFRQRVHDQVGDLAAANAAQLPRRVVGCRQVFDQGANLGVGQQQAGAFQHRGIIGRPEQSFGHRLDPQFQHGGRGLNQHLAVIRIQPTARLAAHHQQRLAAHREIENERLSLPLARNLDCRAQRDRHLAGGPGVALLQQCRAAAPGEVQFKRQRGAVFPGPQLIHAVFQAAQVLFGGQGGMHGFPPVSLLETGVKTESAYPP